MSRPIKPVSRSGLIASMLEEPRIDWIIQAPAGSGKTMLAQQLHRDPEVVTTLIRVDEISDLPSERVAGHVTLLDISVPAVAIDEGLAELLLQAPPDSSTVAFVRCLGPQVFDLVAGHHVGHLTGSDLWFTPDEVTTVAEDNLVPATAALIQRSLFDLTYGWPAAVSWLVQQAGSVTGPSLTALLNNPRKLHGLIDQSLKAMSENDRRDVRVLSLLPVFDTTTSERIGSAGIIDRLSEVGFAIVDTEPGWWTIPAPVRWLLSNLGGRAELTLDQLQPLINAGRALQGVEACIANGQLQLGAQVLASIGIDDTGLIKSETLDPLVANLRPFVGSEPRTFLVRARVARADGRATQAAQLLREGHKRTQGLSADDPARPVAEEIHAELAHISLLTGELERCAELIADAAEFVSPSAQARVTEIRAGLLALNATTDDLNEADLLYAEAAATWRLAGQQRQAEAVQAIFAFEVLARQCRFRDAVQVLDRQVNFLNQSTFDRGVTHAHRARMLAWLNETAEAQEALLEAEHASRLLAVDWMRGYCDVTRAVLASLHDDLAGVVAHASAATISFGELINRPAGALVLEELAVAFARCSAADQAFELLEQAADIPRADIQDLRLARVSVEARVGDPRAALRLLTDARVDGLAENWYYVLLEAVAELRSGNLSCAQQRLVVAETMSAEVNNPNGPERCDPAVVMRIRGSLAKPKGPSELARTGESQFTFELSLFGRFEVKSAGAAVKMPPGQPQTLLKLLALNRGFLSTDAVIDTLWDQTSLDVGRRRLRNVLSRLRSTCGEIVVRDGDVLRLAVTDSSSDFEVWWHRAADALATGTVAIDVLTDLVSQAELGLLPADTYAEWLQQPRRQFESRLLLLLERLVDAAQAEGRPQLAISAREQIARLDVLAI